MSVLVGLHVQEVLNGTKAVTDKVGDRIYPLYIPVGTPEYPFICFSTGSITVEESKDGTASDMCDVEIAVVAKSYGEAVRIAADIRKALEGKCEDYEEFSVDESRFTSFKEEYLEEVDAVCVTSGFNFVTSDNL
jgi:hypothetical protein